MKKKELSPEEIELNDYVKSLYEQGVTMLHIGCYRPEVELTDAERAKGTLESLKAMVKSKGVDATKHEVGYPRQNEASQKERREFFSR